MAIHAGEGVVLLNLQCVSSRREQNTNNLRMNEAVLQRARDYFIFGDEVIAEQLM